MTISGNVILIFFAIVQRMAMRLTYGARGPQPDDKVYHVLNVVNWLLFIGAAIPLLVVTGGLGLLIILFVMGAVDEGLRASRQLQRQTTITLLSLAATRSLPLAGTVFRNATDQGGSVGRAARRLVRELERGEELSVAIRRNQNAVPREAVAYAAVGEASGDVAAALAEASRQPPGVLSGLYRLLVDRIAYLGLLSVFMAAMVTFLILKIVPEFAKILYEFDIPLPAATEILMAATGLFTRNALAVVPLLLFLLLALLVTGVLSLCGIPVFQGLGDRMLVGRHRAVVLRSLALAAERGQPFERTIAVLAETYPSANWRLRLQKAYNDQSGGTEWSEALRRARVIRGATGALVRAGERVGNLPWTLRTAADREETRDAYRWTAGVQIVFPLLILTFAAAVGFICYALFTPLVELIRNVAPTA